MRTTARVLVVLAACADESRNGGVDSAPQATVQSGRDSVRSTAAEVRFLDHMIEHQKRLADLLLFAGTHRLSTGSRQMVEHAERHRSDTEAELHTSRRRYASDARGAYPPAVASGNSIEEFRGSEYERRLVLKLVDHYREEVAEIDAALPELRAQHVRSLANQIRSERLHEIRDLTGTSHESPSQ